MVVENFAIFLQLFESLVEFTQTWPSSGRNCIWRRIRLSPPWIWAQGEQWPCTLMRNRI